MKVITEGHRYELDNFEDSNNKQVLQFIHKEPNKETHSKSEEEGTLLHTVSDGTTNEEVLRVLIDRLNFLHDSLPDKHTAEANDYCVKALESLEARTADREVRKVEGMHQE